MTTEQKPKPLFFGDGIIKFSCPFTLKFSVSNHTKWTNTYEQYWFVHMIDIFYRNSKELQNFADTNAYTCLNITNNIHDNGKGSHFNGTFTKKLTTGEFANSPEFHFYVNAHNTEITHVSFCTTFK